MSGLVLDHVGSPTQFFREVSAVLAPKGQAVVAAVHPDVQRLTGTDISIQGGGDEDIHIPGHLHEVEQILAAVRNAGMIVSAMGGTSRDRRHDGTSSHLEQQDRSVCPIAPRTDQINLWVTHHDAFTLCASGSC
jgi:hypothetical protein